MHRPIWLLVAAIGTATGHAARQAAALQPSRSAGCYRADRALGTSAGSAIGRGVPGAVGRRIGEDSTSLPRLTTFRLLPNGRVARPDTAMGQSWEVGSTWASSGDTLHVTLSTATSGWALQLLRAPSGGDRLYVGTARYLTDVVVADTSGWTPPQYSVRVTREPCAPPA